MNAITSSLSPLTVGTRVRIRKGCAARSLLKGVSATITDVTALHSSGAHVSNSGYTHCACRDCFEIVVSDDESNPDLCSDCEEAGCDPEKECRAPHAYCSGGEGEVVNGIEFCTECFQPF